MSQNRDALERQLKNAQESLAAYESRRQSDDKKKGVEAKKDPKWRQLDRTRRGIVTRLKAVEKQEEMRAATAGDADE